LIEKRGGGKKLPSRIRECKTPAKIGTRDARFLLKKSTKMGKMYQKLGNIPKIGKYTKMGNIYQNEEAMMK
jgi:hypothetical protein